MKVLVPVDGSASSLAALDFVATRARFFDPRTAVQLLNVQLPIPPRAARVAGREMVRSYHRAEAHAVLDPALQRMSAVGLRAKVRYAVGSPRAIVSQAATYGHPDLVVMGSRGQTALAGLVFGSVTQAVLAASTTPLLVVREGPPPRAESLRVVIAADGSRHGLAAIRFVLAHRALLGPSPRFSLVHVLDSEADAAEFDAATGPSRALFMKAGIDVEVVRLAGRNAGDAIAKHVAGATVDLVVMGSHGRSAFKAVILGSVATRVAAKCRVPLLIVRPRPARSRTSPAGGGKQSVPDRAGRAGGSTP
jgi:nucleotide-binding universal stress UspA family protein